MPPLPPPLFVAASWQKRACFGGRSWIASEAREVIVAIGGAMARFDVPSRRVEKGVASRELLDRMTGLAPLARSGGAAPGATASRADTPPDASCWFGWIGYEAANWLAEGPPPAAASSGDDLPDLWLMRAERVEEFAADAIEAHLARARAEPSPAGAVWLASECVAFREEAGASSDSTAPSSAARRLDRSAFESAVREVREAILAGTLYQANLVRRVDLPGAIDAVALLARLGRDAPVSHAALAIDGAGGAVVSHSPELLLRARADGRLETRPIKGTARLADHAPSAAGAAASGRDAAGAEAAYRALLASAKERAEHLMIVDLERNDLGRIARTGTVRVEELFGRLDLPHLVHLESTISAEPRDGLSPWEAVAAVFPGGSITGAPKLKAMELIRALEPARRGVSMGAVGWIGSGSLHLNVAIRTLSRPGGHPGGRPGCGWRYHVGGGIVVDSDPAAEWRETETKERALREAAAALAQL